ncbi:MAG: flavodoxin family protein [Methanospirillaceae archaeon]|nr:flavodoxin family protein [Methanospirillaceae archaeon]
MKVVAFNGSPRKEGNTGLLIAEVLSVLQDHGIRTELIQIGGERIRGCTACGKCRDRQDRRCIITDDSMNEYIAKMIDADGIIIGSPTYFSDLSPETKALIDRAGYVCRGNNQALKRKVGAAVVAVRRAGGIHVFDSINHFFLISDMIVPGSSYWNIGIGLEPGDVLQDKEGVATMRQLGENMAWLLKTIHGR